MIDGKTCKVPTNTDGSISVSEILKAANTPANKTLVMMDQDGSNHVVNPNENLCVNPGQRFIDMDIIVRGNRYGHM